MSVPSQRASNSIGRTSLPGFLYTSGSQQRYYMLQLTTFGDQIVVVAITEAVKRRPLTDGTYLQKKKMGRER